MKRRPVYVNAHEVAMRRAAKLSPSELSCFVTPMRETFDAARRGRLTLSGWRGMADRLNVAEALARRGIASDRLQQFVGGQVLLSEILDRFEQRTSWTLYPKEIAALQLLVDLHAIQLSLCSRGELADATDDVIRRVTAAKRHAGPGVAVYG